MRSRLTKSRRRLIGIDIAVGLLTVALVTTGIWFQLQRSKPGDQTCQLAGTSHSLTVRADAFDTARLTINRCDSIRVVNTGTENYIFAFGEHDEHVEYPGFTMQALSPNEYFILQATQAGTYRLHDHIRNIADVQLVIKARD